MHTEAPSASLEVQVVLLLVLDVIIFCGTTICSGQRSCCHSPLYHAAVFSRLLPSFLRRVLSLHRWSFNTCWIRQTAAIHICNNKIQY